MFAERVYTRDGLRFTGTGIEMNVQVNLFYQFAGHLRLGVAHGFSDNGSNQAWLQSGSSF